MGQTDTGQDLPTIEKSTANKKIIIVGCASVGHQANEKSGLKQEQWIFL